MLRALVVLLLLANALVLAWSLGALDRVLGRRAEAEREPERLQRQVHPELVRLLPPAAASAALAAASAPPAAKLCLEAGPLPATALAMAEKAMLDAGVGAGSWTTASGDPKGLFLIYMGRYDDEDMVQRKLEELKRRRIDAQPVRNADLQPGVEVGRFDDKAEADAALARLSLRGLRTARVLTLSPPVPQVRLRLPAADPSLREALAVLKLAPGVEGFSACAAAASVPAASATVTAATSGASAPGATAPGASTATVAGAPAVRPAASSPRVAPRAGSAPPPAAARAASAAASPTLPAAPASAPATPPSRAG